MSFTKLIQDTTNAYIRNNKEKIIFLVGICVVKGSVRQQDHINLHIGIRVRDSESCVT